MMYWKCKTTFATLLLSSVSLDDISAVRLGRQTEGLRKYTEEQVEGRCFSIMFKGRRKNLDLIASSEEEAKQWVSSLEKMVSSINNLSTQQKTEQYPYHESVNMTDLQAEGSLLPPALLLVKTQTGVCSLAPSALCDLIDVGPRLSTLWEESRPFKECRQKDVVISPPYIQNLSAGSSAAWRKQTRTKTISWVSQSWRASCASSTSRWMTTTQRCSSRWRCPQSFLMVPKYQNQLNELIEMWI